MKSYIERFEDFGFGMFVHFGLYSVLGKGEWAQHIHQIPAKKYQKLADRFNPTKNWAKDLAKTAKRGGCKYITITTRHHDGFSLFDTKGMSTYDAPSTACGRDLIKEFTDACRAEDIMPFFYHTLLDWHNQDYKNDFKKYIDYLDKSIELLCKNYGKIGGFWFDGMWDKPNEDWQEDKIYSTIRKYQPEAMIINNTGLHDQGKVGHPEIDSVTFERGNPSYVDQSDKRRAGEMCQVFNDHWGYAKNDCNYKPVKQIIEDLVSCRKFSCNFLLNTGLKGNGTIKQIEKGFYSEIGNWIKTNKSFIYNAKSANIEANNAYVLKDENYYYVAIKDVPMAANLNVALCSKEQNQVNLSFDKEIAKVEWLDSGKKVEYTHDNGELKIVPVPFEYGKSFSLRVAKITVK